MKYDVSVLKKIKRAVVAAGKSSGAFRLMADSAWRRDRLLILGYHGVSLEDEHEWNGALYLSPAKFRARMEAIQRHRCNVLPLHQALDLLRLRQLPPRSVVLTFDDGTYDFYKNVCPVLKEFGYPATVYLATYWMTLQLPVVPGAWSYMLWKKRDSVIDASSLFDQSVTFDLRTPEGRTEALTQLRARADSLDLDGVRRDAMSRQLADLLGFDYQEFYSKRIIQLLRPDEVKAVASSSVAVELHTHHHRTAKDRETYIGELQENRRQINGMLGSNPIHFCYPSGNHKPEHLPWLREAGVVSATTCVPGIVSVSTNPLQMPRLVDTSSLSDVQFEGWLAGFGALLPHRVKRHHE
ncbi:MAG: polysaccharide deacetylase family protein [Terriglobales bacterium]